MALFRIGNLIELPTHTPRLGLQLSNGACLGLKLLLVARLQSNIDRLSVLLPEVTFSRPRSGLIRRDTRAGWDRREIALESADSGF